MGPASSAVLRVDVAIRLKKALTVSKVMLTPGLTHGSVVAHLSRNIRASLQRDDK